MKCLHSRSKTITTRPRQSEDKFFLYRRRQCLACGERFSTAEFPMEEYKKIEEFKEFIELARKIVQMVG